MTDRLNEGTKAVMGITPCPICESERDMLFETAIYVEETTTFSSCPSCGLIQTGTPGWLERAYRNPIADVDTGIMERNLLFREYLTALLPLIDRGRGPYVDVGGGYGILTRLMRDLGFDYHWHDPFCANLVAQGFDADDIKSCAAISLVEGLEHLYNPVTELRTWMETFGCSTIMATTLTYPDGPPPNKDWWYYSLNTGQHVSFYCEKTLHALAERLELRYLRVGQMHILTTRNVPTWAPRVVVCRPIRKALVQKRRMANRQAATCDRNKLLQRSHH